MAGLRIYTDENVDVRVAEGLRRRGIDARSAADEGQLGRSDIEQFAHATALRAAIFTHDHHFIELAAERLARGEEHFGVLFVEIHRLGLGECIEGLAIYARLITSEEMMGRVEFL